MDVKVSNKQTMMQPYGPVDVLVEGVFDFFPVTYVDSEGVTWIEDIEVFSEEEWLDEELDRVSFAVIRSKGQDPIDPNEGIQWSEMMLGEIPAPLLMNQIMQAGQAESQFVQTSFQTVSVGGKQQLSVAFNAINPATVRGRETGI